MGEGKDIRKKGKKQNIERRKESKKKGKH